MHVPRYVCVRSLALALALLELCRCCRLPRRGGRASAADDISIGSSFVKVNICISYKYYIPALVRHLPTTYLSTSSFHIQKNTVAIVARYSFIYPDNTFCHLKSPSHKIQFNLTSLTPAVGVCNSPRYLSTI